VAHLDSVSGSDGARLRALKPLLAELTQILFAQNLGSLANIRVAAADKVSDVGLAISYLPAYFTTAHPWRAAG